MTEPVTLLLYGEDEPRLKEALSELTSRYLPDGEGFDVSRIDGMNSQVGEFIGPAMTLPFLAEFRVIIVENYSLNPTFDDGIKELGSQLIGLPQTTRLIFVEKNLNQSKSSDSQTESSRKARRKKFLENLAKIISADPRGEVLTFEVPSDPAAMVRWMQERAAVYGVTIDRPAAAALSERINEDLVLANSELEKLSSYVGEGGVIHHEAVNLLTPYSADASIFAMVDALGERDGSQALFLLHRLLDEGDDPLRIFGMITRQYRLILQMRELLDKGISLRDAGKAAGINQSFVSEKVAKQARRYPSIGHLDRIYEHLLSVDVQIKTGKIDPVLALDKLIAVLNR